VAGEPRDNPVTAAGGPGCASLRDREAGLPSSRSYRLSSRTRPLHGGQPDDSPLGQWPRSLRQISASSTPKKKIVDPRKWLEQAESGRCGGAIGVQGVLSPTAAGRTSESQPCPAPLGVPTVRENGQLARAWPVLRSANTLTEVWGPPARSLAIEGLTRRLDCVARRGNLRPRCRDPMPLPALRLAEIVDDRDGEQRPDLARPCN
jgi:hypothetical protein